jgi:uncharacterized RDD family membrane protein YckC
MADGPSPSDPQRRDQSLPGRLLGSGARGARRVAGATGIDRAVETATEDAIVAALESPAVERALARVLHGPIVEEAMQDALDSAAVERALTNALDSDMVDRVWQRLLASDEAQQLVERIAQAPEVRSAIAAQGVGFLDDIRRELGRAARRLDGIAERIARALLRRPRRAEPPPQAGVVSRALALGLDALILNGLFVLASAAIALFFSVVLNEDHASAPVIAIGASAWVIFGALYLSVFWTLAGQTPGMRFLGLRLDVAGRRRLTGHEARRRLAGLVLAAVPLGAGFVPILYNERRQGWQDRLAGTQVLYTDTRGRAAPWSEPGRAQAVEA